MASPFHEFGSRGGRGQKWQEELWASALPAGRIILALPGGRIRRFCLERKVRKRKHAEVTQCFLEFGRLENDRHTDIKGIPGQKLL